MTLFDSGPIHKHCLVYCGDDRCNCQKAPRYRDALLLGVDDEPVPPVVAPPSGSCGEVEGRDQGASSKDDRALAEGEAADASSSLRDGDPSRITLEGVENLLWELSRDRDTEPQDMTIFRDAWSRLQEYRSEARRIIFATHGHWSAWSEEELDSDPTDPLVGRMTEWFVGFWRAGEPEADTYVRTGSGRSAERIARELASDLNEMISLVARARDEQPKAEDPKGLSPQGASPVDEVEAPASLVQSSPTPPGDLIQVAREEERNRSLTAADRLIVFACYHADKLGPALAAELEQFAAEWQDEVEALHRQEKVEDRPEGWQPIETAPRDGTIIQVCASQAGPYAAYYGMAREVCNPGDADKNYPWVILDETNGTNCLAEGGPHGARFWRPLSAYPRPSHERQG